MGGLQGPQTAQCIKAEDLIPVVRGLELRHVCDGHADDLVTERLRFLQKELLQEDLRKTWFFDDLARSGHGFQMFVLFFTGSSGVASWVGHLLPG